MLQLLCQGRAEAGLVVTGNERHQSLGRALCPVQQPHMSVPYTALLHIPKTSTGWSLTSHLSHGQAGEQLYSLDLPLSAYLAFPGQERT